MKIYQQFPIPLINRMEKHFVFTENVLTRPQMQIATEISDWIKKFSNVATGYVEFPVVMFELYDAVCFFCLVATSSSRKKMLSLGTKWTHLQLRFFRQLTSSKALIQHWQRNLQSGRMRYIPKLNGKLIHSVTVSDYFRLLFQVKQKSKRLLIYTASPDALIRLQKSALKSSQKELCHIYFSEQHHSSLQDYLRHHASVQSSKNYFQVSN